MIEKIEEGIFARKINVLGEEWSLTTFLWVTNHMNLYLDAGLGEDAIRELSIYADPTKPNTCIYSHSHYDHIWGAGVLDHPRIIAHKNFLRHNRSILLDQIKYAAQAEGNNEVLPPTLLISKDTDLDEEILILTAKGHTDDGLMVYHKTLHILFMGDVAADEGKVLPEVSGSIHNYFSTLNKLNPLRIDFILSSHRNIEKKTYLDSLLANAYIFLKNCQ
jgi:glyoxylase-like metal-dependent hydrolase (beta-lactamase superfamily II)